MQLRSLIKFTPLFVFSFLTMAENPTAIPAVIVKERKQLDMNLKKNTQDLLIPLNKESSEVLKQLPGVSASRNGGHGSDLSIRGLKEAQINIIDDGAFVHGGCPNRMDPPTAYTQIENSDHVEIIRGYQNVEYGFGGIGGTVLIEKDNFKKRNSLNDIFGKAVVGFESNSDLRHAQVGVGGFFGKDRSVLAEVGASKKISNNFQDGADKVVRSSFEDERFNGSGVWFINDDSEVALNISQTKVIDAIFDGTSMDAPYSKSLTFNLNGEFKKENSLWSKLKFNLYQANVDHNMDNFSLKTTMPSSFMLVNSTSDTRGLKVTMDTSFLDKFKLGIDFKERANDAKRFSGSSRTNVSTPQSYIWPDTNISEFAIFSEKTWNLLEHLNLITGLRFEHVEAKADKANIVTGSISPLSLYSSAYSGTIKTKQKENNINAVVRTEYELNENILSYLSLAQSYKTADQTERFMGITAAASASKWIGNPNLSPEKHQVVEFGANFELGKLNSFVSVYHDSVQNFIFKDTAKLQSGIKLNSGETIYRNIEASLMGFEIGGNYQFTSELNLTSQLAYVRGENKEKSIPLPQINPLFGSIDATYTNDDYSLKTTANFALKQTRVDTNSSIGSGRDKQQTPSWLTFDIVGGYEYKGYHVKLGVKNLFNKNYVQHINRADLNTPTEVQVHEPGRSIFTEIKALF